MGKSRRDRTLTDNQIEQLRDLSLELEGFPRHDDGCVCRLEDLLDLNGTVGSQDCEAGIVGIETNVQIRWGTKVIMLCCDVCARASAETNRLRERCLWYEHFNGEMKAKREWEADLKT